ncbi:MAG: hypothetical protein H0W89_05640 [Candidatus Levybacteria bacterium]|nr:hypothetical protein [Candidatus Levybacteria bacterium]
MLLFLGILAGVINAVCYVPYIKDILKGKTKPNRASWLIWALLGFVAFFSLMSKGANPSLWLIGIQTVGLVTVFILSFKYGSGSFTKKEYIALCFAASGLLVWYFTKEPAAALYIAIIINAIGSLLMIHKAYKDPGSETRITWILGALAGFVSILSVGSYDILLLSFPIYTFLSCSAVVIAMILGDRRYEPAEYTNAAYEYDLDTYDRNSLNNIQEM